MNTKLYPHELSKAQKRAFYNEETVEGHIIRKKALLVMTCLTLVLKTVLEWVIFPRVTGSHYPLSSLLAFLVFGVGITCFVIVVAIDRKNKDFKLFYARIITLTLAWLGGTVFITITIMHFCEQALKTEEPHDWILAAVELANGTQVTILVYLIVPIWQLKGSVSFCYFLGLIIALFKADNELKYFVLVKGIGLGIYVLVLTKTFSQLRWELFAKNLETEGWCKIYKDILNKIPSHIVVLNMDSTVAFSNTDLMKSSSSSSTNESQKALLDCLVQIKSRTPTPVLVPLIKKEKEKDKEEDPKLKDMTDRESLDQSHSKHIIQYMSESPTKLLDVDTPDTLTSRGKMTTLLSGRLKLKNQMKSRSLKSMFEFANFEELFDAYKQYFFGEEKNQEKNVEDDQFIFDGKLINSELNNDENRVLSYEIRLFPLHDYNKVIVVLNNTTQRDIIAGLENNNEYKDRLLASVSHELRTPLNANISFLQEALSDKRVPEIIKEEFLDLALRSSKVLLYIINDILDYSLVQSEELSLSLESRSLKETMTNTYKLVEKAMKAKKLDYRISIDNRIPDVFCTDHGRVTQIILNLLNNALKFTFRGKVSLKAVYVGFNQVKVSVTDTGMGMSDSEVQNIFLEMIDNKPRELSSSQSKSKGIGLGLKVVNSLVRKLGPSNKDHLEVESEEGRGSRFTFYLKDQQEMESFENENEHQFLTFNDFPSLPDIESIEDNDKIKSRVKDFFNGKAGQTPRNGKAQNHVRSKIIYSKCQDEKDDALLFTKFQRILIVDDDPFNIVALKALLNRFGFIIDEAYNGREAVDKILIEKQKYRLIFMDCQMPIMDGYEATRELTDLMEKGVIEDVNIVGCTAFTSKTKIDECFRSGMKNVITKPVMKDKLSDLIRQYFSY